MSRRIPVTSTPQLLQVVHSILEVRHGGAKDLDPFATPTPYEVVEHDNGVVTLTCRVEDRDPMEGGGLKDETMNLAPNEQLLLRTAI